MKKSIENLDKKLLNLIGFGVLKEQKGLVKIIVNLPGIKYQQINDILKPNYRIFTYIKRVSQHFDGLKNL